MKFVVVFGILIVLAFLAWRLFCLIWTSLRPVRIAVEKHTDVLLDRAGFGRLVDVSRRFERWLDTLSHGSNVAAKQRGDDNAAKAEERRENQDL